MKFFYHGLLNVQTSPNVSAANVIQLGNTTGDATHLHVRGCNLIFKFLIHCPALGAVMMYDDV